MGLQGIIVLGLSGWVTTLGTALALIKECRRNERLVTRLKAAESGLASAQARVDYWTNVCAVEARAHRATGRLAAERASRIDVLERRLANAERQIPRHGRDGRFVSRAAS